VRERAQKSILVIGYGNPGRQDDGLGPALAERIEALDAPDITVDADYQLNIEHAAMMAEHQFVLFVDASEEGAEPFGFREVGPAKEIAFSSHTLSAESVLAICEEHFDALPETWLLGIRGYGFDFIEELTPQAKDNLDKAEVFVLPVIGRWREKAMASTGTRKTILTIDDDPDIRATLRIVLEAEGFSVGEAANGEEGLKIAERIQPDAVLIDLMMESVDSGSVAAQKLKETGYQGPIYMLSSAGDSVRYNIDAREMGLAGIFQKPIDPKTLVATLKAKLKDA
jgi:hydrogenase maturation protease